MRAALALAALLAAPADGAGQGAAWRAELKRLESQGYRVAGKASAGRWTAAVLEDRSGRTSLRVYRAAGGKQKLAHLDPGFGLRLALSPVHADGRLPDLLGDGSLAVAYTAAFPGVGRESLVLLRIHRGKVERLGDLPSGRLEDVDGDGRLEAVSRARPLGQWFIVDCQSFHAMGQSAFRTSVHALEPAGLRRVSERHRGYFEELIRRRTAELSRRDPRAETDYSGYFGEALSLYFDHAEIGRGREGWRRFKALFPTRRTDPPVVKRCLRKMEDSLREKLGIPPDW